MNYTHYSAKDFVKDPYFQKWVLDPDEKAIAYWAEWLANHPFKKSDVEEAVEIIKALGFDNDIEANIAFIDVWHKINAQKADKTESRPVAGSTDWFKQYQRMAAVFVGLLILGCGIFFLTRDTQSTASFATKYGEVKTFMLPDSSLVTLNSNSSVTYPTSWSQERPREVWLKGEAFFSVLKKKQERYAKFKVHTADLTVEVLGTKFNVNSRRNSTKVVLNSGKVQLKIKENLQEQTVAMEPGDLVKYSNKQKDIIKERVTPALHSAWQHNRLEFYKTPLRDIAALLEDNYGLQLVFQDSALAGKNFTGMFPANDIDLMLSTFSKLYDLEASREKNRITLSSSQSGKAEN